MGAAACLEVDEAGVIVTSIRDQAFGHELFTAFGFDPRQKRMLVLKSREPLPCGVRRDRGGRPLRGCGQRAAERPARSAVHASIAERSPGSTTSSNWTAFDLAVAVSARIDANDGVRPERQRKRAIGVGVLAAGAEGGGVTGGQVGRRLV